MYVGIVLFLCAVSSALFVEDKSYWSTRSKEELLESLRVKWNENEAKNVILFVGDGMGPNTVTAARIFKGNGNEQAELTFDRFPHLGMLKTYCADKQVPDSASTATALFCGVKGNYHTSGVDANVKKGDCEASLNKNFWVSSVVEWAQKAGKDTGFVTTTRVTHATPSALYAHSPERNWECEAKMPENAKKCQDIAKQLIENEPGKNIKVIMGGGRQCLVSNATGDINDPIDTWACRSRDGRNLINTWQTDKKNRGFTYVYLKNKDDLWNFDIQKTDFLLGIFANGHLPYEHDHIGNQLSTMPTLSNMTSVAIRMLQKNRKGYLLVVEGGMIDYAHHRGLAKHALYETVAMDEAIATALQLTDTNSDTLIIVTSDHAHSLSINGYPERGNSIVGLAGTSEIDQIPYTTLTYMTGDLYSYKYNVTEGGKVYHNNPMNENHTSFEYHQHAGILTNEVLHGGSDVAVYAKGTVKDKIFIAAENDVRGFTKKGKLFLGFDTNLTESIKSMYVSGSNLLVCGNYAYNQYHDCKDANSFLCNDRINDVIALVAEKTNKLTPVLACEDKILRVLDYSQILHNIELESVPTVLHLNGNDGGENGNEILYGTADGRIGMVQIGRAEVDHKWILNDEKRRSGIISMDCYDITGDGVLDIIVGREDGVVEVFCLGDEGDEENGHLTQKFSYTCTESITSVQGGVVGNAGYDEIVASTYTDLKLKKLNKG